MRNLEKYPITLTDVMMAIEDSHRHHLGKGYIGDTTCYCLMILKEYIQNNKEFEEYLKSKELKNV
jgi:hypothetical protein